MAERGGPDQAFTFVDDNRPMTLRRRGVIAVRDTDVVYQVNVDITITLDQVTLAAAQHFLFDDDGATWTPIPGLTLRRAGGRRLDPSEYPDEQD